MSSPASLEEARAAVERGDPLSFLPFYGHAVPADGSVGPTCLSQWYPAPFVVEGVRYPTAEHWMMAGKARLFGDAEMLEAILASATPAEAKRLGRKVRGFREDAWAPARLALVVEGNVHKFAQNPALWRYLDSTGDAILVEASPRDRVWGVGLSVHNPAALDPRRWRGRNLLGFALGQARARLRARGAGATDDVPALLARVQGDPGLARVLALVGERLDDDPGHDLGHVLRVARWTVRLARPDELREAIAAALLHDVVNVPKDSPERAQASARSAAVAREVLPSCGFTADAVEGICEAIEDHSYSRGSVPRSALGRALQDADRLEALGALGIMRTFSTGARMGAAYFHPVDPWAERRPLDDRAFSVDHFFRKLLLLAGSMTTERGRDEAVRRTEVLRRFLEALGEELGRPPPRARLPDAAPEDAAGER